MIRFSHEGSEQHVGAGESWTAPREGDHYRDAPAGELAALITGIASGSPWREAVAALYAQSNPWLHRIVTDPCRDLFFRLNPPPAGSLVLDVGAGWGQLSLPLAAANRVVALEPTPERLGFLRAAARQEGLDGRMAFLQSDFQALDFGPCFDLVCCVGVLEWVPRFGEGDPHSLQLDFLRRLRACLAPGGRLVVGIENRLGLKYLLGVPDDHTGLAGVSVLDRDCAQRRHRELTGGELRVLTYSLPEYEELFAAAGLSAPRAWGAWPDYKLPSRLLPLGPGLESALLSGPPVHEHNGYNGAPLEPELQQALGSHYRSLARLGMAGAFAPSYYLEAGPA